MGGRHARHRQQHLEPEFHHKHGLERRQLLRRGRQRDLRRHERNTTVTVSGAVSPSSLTVTGANPYTFTGSGSIYGGTSLVVQGPAALTIANSGGNNYTGGTFVQGGSVVLARTTACPRPAR